MSRGRMRKSTQQRIASLSNSIDNRMNNSTDRGEWVEICRKTLLDMETRNIHRRAKHWTELVNEKVKDTNSRLSLDESIFDNVTKPFLYKVNNIEMNKHLNFIISWKGLKTRQIQNAPKTYVEFENKAKNWLNGRRAPNYAATLFPDMIKASEIYADYVSRQIFPNNPKHSKMYNKICVIGFLSSLCSARISLNDASKKAYLICENSVKTGKTQVSQILQRYASDHPYQDKFPSHLREASDFFENKYMELISDFGIQLNQKKRQDKLAYAKNTGAQVLDYINNDSAHSDGGNSNHDSGSVGSNPSLHSNNNHSNQGSEGGLPSSVTHSIMKDITNCDGNLNAISMSIDQFNQLAKFLSNMITNQRSQQGTIQDLVSRVRQLEDQQQKILNDVTTSNSPRSMNASMNNIPPPTYNNDTSNGHPSLNGGQSVNSSNQSMAHQQAMNGNNNNNGNNRAQFQMPHNPQPGMMQPGANNNNNSNGFGRNNNNNGNGQRGNLNVANITNQNIQPRYVQSGPKQNNVLPNQGRLSPANSHTTNTTKSTNSIPGAQAQQFMNQMNNNVMNGMNTNGINMTITTIPPKNMNMNNNQMNNQQLQMMNNGNNGMVSIPQMTQINNLNNIQNGLPRPQMTNVNMNNMNMQNQMNQMQQMQQQQRMRMQQQNNNNNMNINNQQQIPAIPGAATPSRSTMNGLQGTNTLNAGGIPSTTLGMYGSYDSNDGDLAMHGFGNNQSFNSSDAGMTNMQSMPNNYATTTTQQQQVPLDAGFMPRGYSDVNSTMQPTLQLQSYQ